jgi:hypothetical protein
MQLSLPFFDQIFAGSKFYIYKGKKVTVRIKITIIVILEYFNFSSLSIHDFD